jgi:hypothetical protein
MVVIQLESKAESPPSIAQVHTYIFTLWYTGQEHYCLEYFIKKNNYNHHSVII